MNLYTQVLSQVQSSAIGDLLRFPRQLQPNEIGGRAIISAGGKLTRRRFQSIEEITSALELSKFNQIEIAYAFDQTAMSSLPLKIVSITGVLTPSPTSEVWYASKDWPAGGDKAMRTRKMNAKAAEVSLNHYKVKQKPSIFEVVIEIESTLQQNMVLDVFAEWLAKCVPKALDRLGIFGCVDAGGPEFLVKMESNVLMTADIRIMAKLFPSAYPHLGQRFDALHPVMFGSKRVCDGLSLTLGNDARLIHNDSLSDFAVIRLASDCDTQAAACRAADWLLVSES